MVVVKKRRKPWSDRSLSRQCLKNSSRLQDACQVLVGKKYYGPGFYLLAAGVEEQIKGIVYSMWAGGLAKKGVHNVGRPLTFKGSLVKASATSHQDRFVLFVDLLFLTEVLHDVGNRLGVRWETKADAELAVRTIIRAIRGTDPALAKRLDPAGNLAWAARAHYGAIPTYREMRDSGVYIDFNGQRLLGPKDANSIELEVLREGLDSVRALWRPMTIRGSEASPYAILLVGLLSFVRSSRKFNIPGPWRKDLATRWGYTDPYWIDIAVHLLKHSPLRRR